MKLILLGPPGVGKGTQANLLEKKIQVPKISTGDILRGEIQGQTELGKKAERFIHDGKLVPDDVVIDIIKNRLQKSDCRSGFILDGFPRTLPQAQALKKITSIDYVIYLKVEEEELIRRLEGRRTCFRCAKMYHVLFTPPKKESICDDCGGDLIQRKDDHRDTISKRLQEYDRLTKPLLEYYKKQKNLKEVNGLASVEDVFKCLLAKVETSR